MEGVLFGHVLVPATPRQYRASRTAHVGDSGADLLHLVEIVGEPALERNLTDRRKVIDALRPDEFEIPQALPEQIPVHPLSGLAFTPQLQSAKVERIPVCPLDRPFPVGSAPSQSRTLRCACISHT
eukprot:3025470-Rhodomonas_salina.2